MSTIPAPRQSHARDTAANLLQALRPFRRKLLGLSLQLQTVTVAATVILALLFALWFDTIWALPAGARWWISRGALTLPIVLLLLLAWYVQRRFTAACVAQQIDVSLGGGGQVLAGLQLATQPVYPGGELSRGFALLAVEQAAIRIRDLAPEEVTDRSTLRRAVLLLAAILFAVFLLVAAVPGIAWHQIQRFTFPSSDIPPYTGVELELVPEQDSVLYGQDAQISVNVLRGRVTGVTLVVRSDDGREHSLPMLAETEDRWHTLLTRLTEPVTMVAVSGDSRSRMRRLEVQLTPQILPPQVTITPPAYTRGSVYRGMVPEQGLVGLEGTQVDWEVSSNRPLRTGRLEMTFRDGSTETLDLQPANSDEESNKVVGQMRLSRSGQFSLSVVDVDNLQSHDAITGAITILEDRRPIVRITSPQQLSLATSDIQLPVEVMAEDDYGISQLTLYRSLNGSPAIPVQSDVDGSARTTEHWQLPLPSFGLTPGDEIRLYARAEDNDPAGAKGAESPVTLIRIISVEQFQELMVRQRGAASMQAKYQAARRYMEQLATALREVEEAQAKLAADPGSDESLEQLRERLAEAARTAQQAAREVSQLSQQAAPVDVDRELARRLAERSEELQKMADELQELNQNAQTPLTAADQERIEAMRRQLSDWQQQLTQQAIEPLNTMQAALPLMMDQMRFLQLAQQQRDLSERLNGLTTANSDASATQRRVAELEAEQEQLKQGLRQLLDDIEHHAESLPDDPELARLKSTALEFARAVRASEANAEMTAAQENLLQDNFSDARERAEAAAKILESFIDQCNGMGKAAEGSCQAAFSPSKGGPGLGNSLQQILAMMGVKPGSSMGVGGRPGTGLGWGAGGGFAQRFPGPQNVGMYGSLPTAQTSAGRGQDARLANSVGTSVRTIQSGRGATENETGPTGDASGAAMDALPATYRAKVAEYFRSLSSAISESEKPQ